MNTQSINWWIAAVLLLVLQVMSCNRPVAEFAYDGTFTAPAEISFENQSENAVQYRWNFGDGSADTLMSPSHRYLSSGNYQVQLEAISGKKSRMQEKVIQVKAPDKCLVYVETNYGDMLIELYDATPKHRDNFTKLAEEGFYDSLLFHRVIEGFMIQGGDPDSKDAPAGAGLGRGGPGYTIPAEFVDSLIHVKGALAAARLGDQANPKKESSGSQFYIVQGRPIAEEMLSRYEAQTGKRYSKTQREAYINEGGTPMLDNGYTVFGRIIEGMEVIDKIAEVQTGGGDRPQEDVWMKMKVIK